MCKTEEFLSAGHYGRRALMSGGHGGGCGVDCKWAGNAEAGSCRPCGFLIPTLAHGFFFSEPFALV